MKKFLKRAFVIGLLVFTVLILTVVFGYHLFFAEMVDRILTTKVQQVLSDQLQREVSLEGIHLSFPNPKLVISNLAIARQQALSEGTLLAVTRAQAQVSLRSLISPDIVITNVILDTPDIWVEFDEEGRSNLPVFAQKEEEDPKEPSSFDVQGLLDRLNFPHVELIDARVHFAHTQQQLRIDLGRMNTQASFRMKGFRTRAELFLEDSEIAYQDRGVVPIAFNGTLDFYEQELSLTAFRIEAGKSSIEVNGDIRNLPQAELDLSLHVQAALDEIDRLAKVNQNLSGTADFTGTVSGNIPDVRAEGHLSLPQGTAWELAFGQINADLSYHALTLGIANLHADIWEGKAEGDAELSFSGTPNISAKLSLDQVHLEHVNSMLKSDPPLDIKGPISGDVTVGGDSFDFNDLLIEASLELENDYLYGVDIEQGQSALRIAERTLFIDSLSITAFQGNMQATGQLELYDDFLYHAEVEAGDIALESIMTLIPEPPDIAGRLSGPIAAKGGHFDLPHLELDAELGINDLAAYGIDAKHIQAGVKIEQGILSFPQLRVDIFDGSIQGAGQLGLSDLAFKTQLNLKDIVLERIMQQFVPQEAEQQIAIAGILSGDLECQGDSFALEDITAKADLQGEGTIGIPGTDPESAEQRIEQAPFALNLTSTFQDSTVSVGGLRVDSDALRVESSGSIDLSGPRFDLNYDVSAQNLQTLMQQALAFVPGIEKDSFLHQFAGNIEQLSGGIHGPLSALDITAKAHLTQADLAWALADDLRADISFKDNTLHIQQAKLRYQGAEIESHGKLKLDGAGGPELHLPISIKGAPLADYLALAKLELPVEGSLESLDLLLEGPAENIRLELPLSLTGIDAWGQRFDSLSGTIRMADNQISTDDLTLKKNGGRITSKGLFGFDLSFQAEVEAHDIDLHNVDALESLALQYQGKIDLKAQASGSIDDPRATAEITLKELRYAETPIDDVYCDISLAGQELETSLTSFHDKFRVSLGLRLDQELPYNAEVEMSEAAIEQILSIFVELEGITGLISGKIVSEGKLTELQDISADVKLSQLDLDIFGQKMSNSREIDIVVSPDALHVNSLEIGGKELGLFAKGDLDFQGNFDLDIDGILDLRGIRPFLPKDVGISSLGGHVQLICSIEGDFRDPRLEGLVELNRGSIKLAAYPDPITGINGKLAFAPGKVEVLNIQGAVSSGTFNIGGYVNYKGFMPGDFSIDVEGKHLIIDKYVDSLTLNVSPRIRLSGDLQQQKLAGEIQVHDALYSKDFDIMSLVGNKNRNLSLPPLEGQPKNPIMLELFIKAPQNVRVKNKLADIDLKANLRVLGTALKPQVEGRVEIPKGRVVFGDVRYNILGGVLDFLDPVRLNPEMNVQVETTIQEYDINLGIDGNLDQFSLNMSSDPPLSDSEIVQLIAAGTGSQTDAYNFVTRPLQTVLEGKLEETFRLDRLSVDVDPLLSNSKNSESTPTVTVAKRFFDALMLTYTTSVGGTDHTQLFEAEYELSDKLSITASRDQDGELDTSVTFKFRLK